MSQLQQKEVQFLKSLVLFELLSLPQWDILTTLFGSLCWDSVVMYHRITGQAGLSWAKLFKVRLSLSD